MSLKPDQEEIKNKFLEFLRTPAIKAMGIQGYGGQGKTYLITHLIDVVNKSNEIAKKVDAFHVNKEVILTATTNKAVEVLQEETNGNAMTVYNLFGLYPTPKYDRQTPSLYKRKRQHNLPRNSIVFIDEASYEDEDLYFNHIKPIAKENKCKLVHVGDKYQLLNVENTSGWLVWDVIPFTYALKTTKRFDDNSDKAKACEAYRATIDTGVFPGGIQTGNDIIPLTGPEFKQKIMDTYSELTYASKNCRILAWTNVTVDNYVKFIRQMHNLPMTIQSGDWCYANGSVTVINGDTKAVNNTELWKSGSTIKLGTKHSLENKILPSTFYFTKERIEADTGVELDFKVFDVQGFDDVSLILPKNYAATDRAIKQFVNNQFKKVGYLNKEIYPFLEMMTNRVSINYASTVHKAQGSTYDTVFINLKDLGKCPHPNTVARLLNVAYSRAKGKVYTYGELPIGYR